MLSQIEIENLAKKIRTARKTLSNSDAQWAALDDLKKYIRNSRPTFDGRTVGGTSQMDGSSVRYSKAIDNQR